MAQIRYLTKPAAAQKASSSANSYSYNNHSGSNTAYSFAYANKNTLRGTPRPPKDAEISKQLTSVVLEEQTGYYY